MLLALPAFAAPPANDTTTVTVQIDKVCAWNINTTLVDFGKIDWQWSGKQYLDNRWIEYYYCCNTNGWFDVTWTPDPLWLAQDSFFDLWLDKEEVDPDVTPLWHRTHPAGTKTDTWPVELWVLWPVPPGIYTGTLLFTHACS
jgi:hypothetical protein